MFYHVVVTIKKKAKEVAKNYIEYDIADKHKIIDSFVIPYMNGKKFFVDGTFLLPENIESLKIYSSNVSASELHEQYTIELEELYGESNFISIGPNKDESVIDKGNDITRNIYDEANISPKEKTEIVIKNSNSKVFIVHGHDDGMKETVARFIEKIGLDPIILHEQANSGKTVIEKFEKNADVGFAIILYTPCDVGGKSGSNDQKPRARQNVVFEHGYFIGKLGRDKVVAVHRNNVEIPSDIQGMLYLSFDSKSWKFELAKEMKEVGFKIDMNDI